MNKTYLGICCSAHDPAIAIINNAGELIYAEAAERILQYKRGINTIADHYPFIAELLKQYVPDESLLYMAKSWSKPHHRNIRLARIGLPLIAPLARPFPRWRLITGRYDYMLRLQAHVFSFSGQNLLKVWKEKERKRAHEEYYDHHRCHAAAGAYSSYFDEAVVAVIDGYGEMTSTAFYRFNDGRLTPVPGIRKSKNSLGFFYSFLCAACGFNPELGEEWKVMGLAPYGEVVPELYERLSRLIPVRKGSFIHPGPSFDIAVYDQVIDAIINRGDHQYAVEDIACTGQQLFEDKMMECLNYLYGVTKTKNLVFVGGCALNSSCNGKISTKTPFENVYVHNAPGDDGTAVGAAILSYLSHNPVTALKRESFLSPYKGSFIPQRALTRAIEHCPFNYYLGEDKYRIAAQLISEGGIVGWVQGRAEFGPRALGNRSILADPRRRDIKDIINKRLKYRESFRPFAPSVLEEFGEEIFENCQVSYYMDKTLVIKPAYRDKIPGVTHVNGTGRLQTVTKELNEGYYQLLRAFHAITGIPVLLNTSFNLAGKPIVHSVDDMVASFFTSGISALIIEDYLFTKEPFNKEHYSHEASNNHLLRQE